MSKQLVLRPRMSEKAYGLSETRNTYVFEVPHTANKLQVAAAVSAQFDVQVIKVNVLKAKGKNKRTFVGKGRFEKGTRSDVKKAYVTLKKGDTITVYAADEPAEKPKKEKKEKA